MACVYARLQSDCKSVSSESTAAQATAVRAAAIVLGVFPNIAKHSCCARAVTDVMSTKHDPSFVDVVCLIWGLVVFDSHDIMQRREVRIGILTFGFVFFEGFVLPPHPFFTECGELVLHSLHRAVAPSHWVARVQRLCDHRVP